METLFASYFSSPRGALRKADLRRRLQRELELRWRSLTLSCSLLNQPRTDNMLQRGAPLVYYHHAGTSCPEENPSPESS
jgi:hypothetical protein